MRSGTSSAASSLEDMSVAAAFAELRRKLDCLMPLRQQVNRIELSVQTMSDHFDSIMKPLDSQDKERADLRKSVERDQCAYAEGNLKQLNAGVNELEVRSRKKILSFMVSLTTSTKTCCLRLMKCLV